MTTTVAARPTDAADRRDTRRDPSRQRVRRRQALVGLAFVLPMFVLFLAFRFGPFVAGVGLSFSTYTLGDGAEWRGLDNFERLAGDPLFMRALGVTAVYTLLAVPLLIAVATMMALLIRRRFRGVAFFRSVFFLPVITSLILAGIIFIWIFNGGGPVPTVLEALGLYSGSWLTHPQLAVVAIVVISVWARFGYDMLIILARLQDVPRELEEAAMMDGANGLQRFRNITLPELKPVFFYLVVIETIGSFQIFDAVYILTGGGPGNATYTLGFMLYDQAFRYFDFGYASAVAVVLFLIVFVLAMIQRRFLGKED